MSFLAPWFLLGALGIGLPLVFHLIRRTTRERTRFSSLMFLLPSPPRVTRRSRLEDVLLLCLRAAALALMTVAFARPFFRKAAEISPAGSVHQRTVILIDTSASMRREALWEAARAEVDRLVRDTEARDQVAVCSFDERVETLVSFDQWNGAPAGDRAGLVRTRLQSLAPGWRSTHVARGIGRAMELLAEADVVSAAEGSRIVLVSDIQEGSHGAELQQLEWPRGVTFLLKPVRARTGDNAGVMLVGQPGDVDTRGGTSVRVRVGNAVDSKRDTFQVGWAAEGVDAFVGKPVEAYVPPGQNRVIQVPGFTNVDATRILLRGDRETFDNVAYAVPQVQFKSVAMYLGSESDRDPKQPLYFLRRGLPANASYTVEVLARQPGAALSPAEVGRARVFFVTEPLGESAAAALAAGLAEGRTVVVAPKDARIGPTVARLSGVPALGVTEARPAQYAMLGEMDFRHPLFAAFADARFSDFTRIHVWHYRRFVASDIPGCRVLARFDSGDPAVMEVPAGRGRLLVFAFGWQLDDSQWALSTKFVPILHSILDWAGERPEGDTSLKVGQPIPVPRDWVAAGAAITVRRPDGATSPLPTGATEFVETDVPGIYALNTPAESRRWAVNLEPSEMRTAPMPLDEFERLGAVVVGSTNRLAGAAARESLPSVEAESRQRLWRWFLAAAVAVLVSETAIAGWASRRMA